MFGQTLAADRKGGPGAGAALVRLANDPAAPAIARATAVAGLERHLDQPAFTAIQRGLGDADPMVRLAAVGTLAGLEPQLRGQVALPLVQDPVRAIRLEAARVLAPVQTVGLPPVNEQRSRPASSNTKRPRSSCSTGRKGC